MNELSLKHQQTFAKRNLRRNEIGSKAIQLKREVTDMCSVFGDVSKRERKRFDCVHCTSFSNIIQIRRDYCGITRKKSGFSF